MLSDEALIQDMPGRLAVSGYRFETAMASIVASRQFLIGAAANPCGRG